MKTIKKIKPLLEKKCYASRTLSYMSFEVHSGSIEYKHYNTTPNYTKVCFGLLDIIFVIIYYIVF